MARKPKWKCWWKAEDIDRLVRMYLSRYRISRELGAEIYSDAWIRIAEMIHSANRAGHGKVRMDFIRCRVVDALHSELEYRRRFASGESKNNLGERIIIDPPAPGRDQIDAAIDRWQAAEDWETLSRYLSKREREVTELMYGIGCEGADSYEHAAKIISKRHGKEVDRKYVDNALDRVKKKMDRLKSRNDKSIMAMADRWQ